MSILRKIAPVAAATVMLLGFAAGAAGSQAGFKAPVAPQPGDCKVAVEYALGANPAIAQQLWVSSVAAKFGTNWSRWPAAQAKAVVFAGQNQYLATGKPCFTYPAG